MRVPYSLGLYAATATPLYLSLTAAPTANIQKWRNITPGDVYSNANNTFFLPPPKLGMGLGTHSETMDDVEFWQVSSVGDKARMILGDTIFYGVSNISKGFVDQNNLATYEYMLGKSSIPKDLSALQYKGMRKRAYNFSFELFAFNNADFESITSFTSFMHRASMPTAREFQTRGAGSYVGVGGGRGFASGSQIYTPSVFMFKILSGGDGGGIGQDVTNNWFLEPKPCSMIGFNSAAVDYQAINRSHSAPARVAVNMLLAEIEPVVSVGDGGMGGLFGGSTIKSIFQI